MGSSTHLKLSNDYQWLQDFKLFFSLISECKKAKFVGVRKDFPSRNYLLGKEVLIVYQVVCTVGNSKPRFSQKSSTYF